MLVRTQKDKDKYESLGYTCFLADLRDSNSIKGKFDNAEVVFHLGNIAAWWLKRKKDYYEINVDGTRNLLDELESTKVKKIIHMSSIAAIRQPEGEIANEDSIHKGDFESDYSKSKFLVEKEVKKYIDKGMPIVVLNPGVITGPKDFKTFGKTVIGIANKKIKAKFCPQSYIPLVHINDVIKITLRSLEMLPGQKYIIVSENVKIGEIFDKVCEIMKISKINKITPKWQLYLISYLSEFISFFTKKRPKLPIDGLKAIEIGAQATSLKSQKDLNHKYLTVSEILEKNIQWYKKNNYINN
jgi:nucleoside-diphosphate-sugar epimerase